MFFQKSIFNICKWQCFLISSFATIKKIHSGKLKSATGTWCELKNKTGTAIYLVKGVCKPYGKGSKVLGETSGVVELQVKNPKITASQLWIKGIVYIIGQ